MLSVFVVVLIFTAVKSFRVRALLFYPTFIFTFYLLIYLQQVTPVVVIVL